MEELFFADLVSELKKVAATKPSNEFDNGWNAAVKTCILKVHQFFGQEAADDAVNSPAYYNTGKIEVIDFIEDQGLPFHLGSAIKYICRAGKKDPAKLGEDISKAIWYLDRYIKFLKGTSTADDR